ncbi:penicillin-binding protein 2 [Candidatus Saccharibacteria bacterium]|nr:penicillin-binding protein 2 [Candidatus Saccharibacteria bacterium]
MTRVRFLKLVTLAAFLVIAARLFSIQIIEHDKWVEAADAQHTLLEKIVAKRGEIYMMDMNDPVPVVLNQTVYSVIIDPAMTDKEKIKAALEKNAPDKITKDIDELYEIEGLRYFVIARNVSRDAAKAIADEGIAGVWFQNNSQRVYPEGTLASGLLGFVNADGIGQYGVEGSLNEKLKGKDGMLKTISDINNIALSIGDDNIKIPAENGKNIVLTVDRGIQRGVEEILAQAVNETPATNFSALVMEPTTGKVLAMANYPNYDPANYGNVKDASAYINYVTEIPYEPASTCKPFAFSAAINEGRMTGETTYWNEGYEIVDGWRINNAEQRSSIYGEISMKTALYWSLNTGSINALKLLGDDPSRITQSGREKLYDYYHNKFRLGQATGIELIEAEGTIADPNEGYGRDSVYANMTFGQNMYVTMIQVATAFSAVVNGGYYIEPTIIAGEYENGMLTSAEKKTNITQVISEDTSAMMRDLLRNNRNYKVRGGIDRIGYAIGGKSGTAQVVRNGSYDNTMSETIASYIGFGGTDGELPKYVIMVKMWGEGEYMDSGRLSEVAFDPISNFIINYLKIKPGEEQNAD